MPTVRSDSDPAIGDIVSFDGHLDVNARSTGYADHLEYAGFWIRFAATLIDTILLLVIITPLLMWIYGAGYWTSGRFIQGPADFAISYVAPAVATVLLWLGWQATPGKMLLSLRVVDADSGKTLSVGQAAARYVCYFISALPLCLGFIWVGVDRRKQGWHDKIAQTVVVRSKDRGPESVRFDRGPAAGPARAAAGNRSAESQKVWIVVAALVVGSLVAVSWVVAAPEMRWIPYRAGLLTEYRLMPVPMHQPYPPEIVCAGGYLVHVNSKARTTSQVKDDHGRRVPCLP